MRKKFPIKTIFIVSFILALVNMYFVFSVNEHNNIVLQFLQVFLNPVLLLLPEAIVYAILSVFIIPIISFLQFLLIISLFVYLFRKIKKLSKNVLQIIVITVLFLPLLLWVLIIGFFVVPHVIPELIHCK